jgi:tetratricopeptide (TPR) repeat protein
MKGSIRVSAMKLLVPLSVLLLGASWPEPATAPAAVRLLPRADDGLIAYLDQVEVPAEAVTGFLRATQVARTGNHAAAERAFLSLARTTPALSDWAYLLAAEAAARRADTLTVRKYLDSSSDWLAREWGWRTRVRALAANAQPGAAAALALELEQRLQLTSSRADARRTAAELMLANGDTALAVTLLRGLVNSDLDPSATSAAALLLAKASTEGSDLLQSARVLARAGEVRVASNILAGVTRNPQLAGTARAQLRLDLARSHFEARRYADAERISAALAADPAEPATQRAEARVVLGRTLLRRGQQAAAIAQLERVLQSNQPFIGSSVRVQVRRVSRRGLRIGAAVSDCNGAIQRQPRSCVPFCAKIRSPTMRFVRQRSWGSRQTRSLPGPPAAIRLRCT